MTAITLSKLGQEIFEKRYAYPGEKTWAERAKVIARTLASVESDEEKEKWQDKFYQTISSGDLVPGGRIVFGCGRKEQNLLNCYFISLEDSVANIAKTIQDVYKISCGGGGIGFNFSKIRPKGSDINIIKNSAPGSVSVMKMIDSIGEHVKAGFNRRTALLALLEVTHPDILEFLDVKLNKKELTNFNISVGITDRFIEAVQNDEDWYFTFNNRRYDVYKLHRLHSEEKSPYVLVPALSADDAVARAKQHYKVTSDDEFEFIKIENYKAKELWNWIYKSSVEAGCPGILNIDLMKKYSNVSYFEEILGPNPCGEANLSNYANCCLGSVNLSNMVKDGEMDWKRLANAVRVGVRLLDNVLTINHYPLEECKEAANSSRRIGLGVMGFHYALIKLGIRYGSDKCLEFQDRLGETFRNEAYLTSCYLARDKGPFKNFNATKFLNQEFAKTLPARIRMLIKEHGIRNAVLMAIAPTGTISMIMGVSSGIEPIFAALYKRRYRDGNVWKETIVIDPLLKEMNPDIDCGLFSNLDSFVGAYDITPLEHIKVQATWQRYIDQAISKTINLPPDAKWEDLTKIALDYIPYLKGLTIYKEGSKANAPLEAIPLTQENIRLYIENKDLNAVVADGQLCSISGGSCGD